MKDMKKDSFRSILEGIPLATLGSLIFALFCCSKRYGWGWDNFIAEANTGKGMKVKNWMKPIFKYVVPVVVIFLYIYGLVTYSW